MTANQEFSKLVKAVEHGEGFLITRRGRPIAKLVPHMADKTADPEWASLPQPSQTDGRPFYPAQASFPNWPPIHTCHCL